MGGAAHRFRLLLRSLRLLLLVVACLRIFCVLGLVRRWGVGKRELPGLFPLHLPAARMLDFEEPVDLFQGQVRGFHIEK